MTKKANKTEEKFGRGDKFMVPFTMLRIVDGFNVRKDFGDIPALASSIEQNGLKVPFQGYKEGNEFFIVDGGRRYEAAKILHAKGIDIKYPFVLETKGTGEEDRIVNMMITNDGKPLNPLEKAEAVKRLLNFGWEVPVIAKRLAMTPLYVTRLNLLNTSPKKFQNIVASGKISGTLAIKIAGEGKIEEFMEKFDAGEFGDQSESSGPAKKITHKALNKANSIKSFKQFSNKADESAMKNHKKEAFNFIGQMLRNEVSLKEIASFFNS